MRVDMNKVRANIAKWNALTPAQQKWIANMAATTRRGKRARGNKR